MIAFAFRIDAVDGAARAGAITTPRGIVRTPAFMPIGTQGAIKGVHWRDVKASGADIVLGNTYHLMLRPGAERIAELGGRCSASYRAAMIANCAPPPPMHWSISPLRATRSAGSRSANRSR